jgi:hypothetical protein
MIMMKRILVFMAVGITFAPAAFAFSNPAGFEDKQTLGENSPDRMQYLVGATFCEKALKQLNGSQGSESQSGQARGAGIARN